MALPIHLAIAGSLVLSLIIVWFTEPQIDAEAQSTRATLLATQESPSSSEQKLASSTSELSEVIPSQETNGNDITSDIVHFIEPLPVAVIAFEQDSVSNVNAAARKLFSVDNTHAFSLEDVLDSSGMAHVDAYLQSDLETAKFDLKRTNAISLSGQVLSLQLQGFSLNGIKYIVLTSTLSSSESIPMPSTAQSEQETTTNSPLETTDGAILVVDDSPTNLMMAKGLLEELNLPVITVESGEEALNIAEKTSLKCIFMDLQMPDMDGYETTQKIRQIPSQKSTTIIALSGTKSDDITNRMKEYQINEFVLKPLNKEKLLKVLDRQVSHSHVSDNALLPNNPNASSHSQLESLELSPLEAKQQDADQLDMSVIEQMQRDIGLDKTQHMKQVAINEIENRLTVLEDKNQLDRSHLQREAHSIKSTAASFGLLSLANLARQIESLCLTSNKESILPLIEQARKSFENAKRQLQETLN
jgi:Response regulator containing a CheY-like receiver domain and a GGDEF domain